MSAPLERYLTALWGRRGLGAWLLLPLGGIFRILSALRRAAYRLGWRESVRLPVPVVVVGNLTVGGAGKTPLTLCLAQDLARWGRRPGIVSRGYGGHGRVQEVEPASSPDDVGDEPLLMKRRFGGPVFVGRRRADAANALLAAYPDCDVLLCDDGLQHYGLQRDVEIAVFDRRGIQNGWPLPAGPLREPLGRLAAVTAVVSPAPLPFSLPEKPWFRMVLEGQRFYRLGATDQRCGPEAFAGRQLHAVAGIGEPQRFFDHLAALGLSCTPHAFPDHHPYHGGDLAFPGDAILTTEKDAVKFPVDLPLPVWVLPVDARVEPDLARWVLDFLENADGCPSA